jgi:hypothetical protein
LEPSNRKNDTPVAEEGSELNETESMKTSSRGAATIEVSTHDSHRLQQSPRLKMLEKVRGNSLFKKPPPPISIQDTIEFGH